MDDEESFLAIDEYRLDKEWLKQPDLMYEHATMYADAKRDSSEAKSNLEIVKAQLTNKVRTYPEKYGLPDKPTEKAIEAKVLSSKRYRKAHKAMLDAVHAMDVHAGAVKGVEHRKTALEKLVSLQGQNYFSTPRASNEDRQAMDGRRSERVRTSTRKTRKRS